MSRISEKVIWITGASSGIGEALVYELAKKHTKLILSSRRKDELERVKGNCSLQAQPDIRILPLDLAEQSTLALFTEAAVQLFGRVDILINNGGIGQRGLAKETAVEVDRRVMEVNYFGTVALTKYLLPYFIKQRSGHYVTISSVTGKFGRPGRAAYAASKHALHGFFDSLRAESHDEHIKVTMICPGFIQTGLKLSAIKSGTSVLPVMDKNKYHEKTAAWCAQKIIRAIEKQKEEVYLGGREVWGVYLKRFFPSLFSNMIRKLAKT